MQIGTIITPQVAAQNKHLFWSFPAYNFFNLSQNNQKTVHAVQLSTRVRS